VALDFSGWMVVLIQVGVFRPADRINHRDAVLLRRNFPRLIFVRSSSAKKIPDQKWPGIFLPPEEHLSVAEMRRERKFVQQQDWLRQFSFLVRD